MDKLAELIIFEDDSLLVLNKAAGIHSVQNSVSLSGAEEDRSAEPDGLAQQSVASFLLHARPELAHVAERPGDAGLANRLDQMTSGLLLAAKNKSAWLALREQLQRGDVFKSYLALVDGEFFGPQAKTVSGFIGSPYRRAKKVRVYASAPGKKARALPATTTFKNLRGFDSESAALVEVIAHTARRHQIRAQAASIGHPLIGDKLYGSQRKLGELLEFFSVPQSLSEQQNLPDFFLHAWKIKLSHPSSAKPLAFCAPVPLLSGALQQILLTRD